MNIEAKDKLVLNSNLCRSDRSIWSRALLAGISHKEILESYDFVKRIHKLTKFKNVMEVCSGHGLVGHILTEKNLARTVYQIDKLNSKSRNRVENSFLNQHRVYYLNKDLYNNFDDLLNLPVDIIIGVYCCGDLTDQSIRLAIAKEVPVAVVPCCYYGSRFIGCFLHLNGEAGVDIARAHKLSEHSYEVSFKYLKENITPKNRIIIGRIV